MSEEKGRAQVLDNGLRQIIRGSLTCAAIQGLLSQHEDRETASGAWALEPVYGRGSFDKLVRDAVRIADKALTELERERSEAKPCVEEEEDLF